MNRLLNFALALSALALTAASASASTIDFNGLPGAEGSKFTSYTEGGYKVTNTAGQFYVAKIIGAPVPDIYESGGANTVDIAGVSNQNFSFSGVDLVSGIFANQSYSITGYLNGVQQFSNTGHIADVWTQYGASDSPFIINDLKITLTTGTANLDNIHATAVAPEPSSLMLLGTGLVSVAGALRRRIKA